MLEQWSLGRSLVVVLVVLIVCGTIPLSVAAQTDGQTGGTVVVEEGETVDSLEAFGGTVVVSGTVTGDVSAVGGDVRVEETGEVGGDLEAAGGSVTIAGTVDGDVDAAAGSLTVTESGTVGGTLVAGAGVVTISGTLDGDAEIGADTIQLGDEAQVAGDLRYDATIEGDTDVVEGELEEDPALGVDGAPMIGPLASWVFAAYVLAANLLVGALLLALFPRFSDGVAGHVAGEPLRSGLVGVGALLGIPIVLIALAISVVGIPLSLFGGLLFALVLWIGFVYGWFAVATWLLSLVGLGNRWLALVVGLVAGAVLSQLPIPVIGEAISLFVLLVGLGAFARALVGRWRHARKREYPRRTGAGTDGPATE
ncbi:bactofilin family protein [Natronorubrum daqingense]|uniref:Cell shape determination protein CcmA n=1 Tax=Natronorubrum daqingense TaxID=588898 RepID=A0A1N7FA49_9EURY|nr:polymer-forming cytoskeletal protein [Natronorubrum daqingense]APX97645.1 cell shape determination protein CcmA [Natronorubrum daqingense]SIR97248.1 protein CcmA, bactofilin family [Natronorubrum daqingense]